MRKGSGSRSIGEDGELTTSASPVQLAATGGSVVNLCGNLNIILGALSGLVGGGETPRPSATISIDGEGVVRSGGDSDGVDARDLSGLDENARTSASVLDDRVIGERVDLEAALVTVDATPDQAFAVGSAGNGMMSATTELGDVPVGEGFNGDRVRNGSFVVTSVVADTSRTETVQTPGVDCAVGVHSEGVVGARAHMNNVLAQAKLARLQAVELVALDDAATKLVLLARTPGEDAAAVIQGEDMVGTASQLLDLLEGGDEDGSSLNAVLRIKAQDAVVALLKPENLMISMMRSSLSRSER
jgi:hypothetical protein